MRIIKVKPLIDFYQKHSSAEQPLKAWVKEAKKAQWQSPHDIKSMYRSADILQGNRVVFNIGGNKYRLIVQINYFCGVVYIKFIGTHTDYDRIKAEKIDAY
tara:strand:+ start:540 stop:842 length:303 start_codon:yes stop_codon:yes gene_type:complete